MKTLNVLKLNTLQEVEHISVPDTLESLQKLVGGPIEVTPIYSEFGQRGICALIHEEGRILGFEPSLAIICDDAIIDFVFGDIVFLTVDNDGNFASLTDSQREYLLYTALSAQSIKLTTVGGTKQLRYIEL